MKLKLEKCLFPCFFAILVLYGLTGVFDCSPYLRSLRGPVINIPVSLGLCCFVVAAGLGFFAYLTVIQQPPSEEGLTSWARLKSKLLWNFKVIGIPIILIIYVPLLKQVFPLICQGDVYKVETKANHKHSSAVSATKH